MRRDQGIIRDGSNNAARPTGNGVSGRKVRPMCAARSGFVTTRCYSPSGVQLWNGDHGYDVQALTVGPDGVVYQTGAPVGLDLGDSLFHKQGATRPLVTAMRSGGRPVWSWSTTPLGTSLGIAYATTEHVYVGVNRNPLMGNGFLVKINTRTAAEVARLSVDGFYHEEVLTAPADDPRVDPPTITSLPDAQEWGRVRVDASNNVYAIGKTAYSIGIPVYGDIFASSYVIRSSIMKWKADAEWWMLDEQVNPLFAPTGLGVSSSGVVATSNAPSTTFGTNFPIYYFCDTDTNNQAVPAFSSYIIKKKRPVGCAAYCGYLSNAISPNGEHSITIDNTAGGNSYILSSIAAGTDPFDPDIVAMWTIPSMAPGQHPLAINDSGRYAYAVAHGTEGYSVEVRDLSNSLLYQIDHGGDINDMVMLPDGTLYIAGKRVLRADFP